MDKLNLFPGEKKNVSLSLQTYLVDEVDKIAKEYSVSRNYVINQMLALALRDFKDFTKK